MSGCNVGNCPYCDKHCNNYLQKHINSCWKNPNKKVSGICKFCGKEFNRVLYGKYDNGMYCSASCGKKYSTTKNRKDIICEKCGCGASVPILRKNLCDKCFKEHKKEKDYLSKTKKTSRTLCKYCGQDPCQTKDICSKFQLIPKLVKYFNFDKSLIGTKKYVIEFLRIKNMLIDDYEILSVPDIAIKYKFKNFHSLYSLFRALNIERRDNVYSTLLAFIQGKLNFKTNISHITWFNEQVMCRSSYEIDFCERLDKRKIFYQVEPFAITYYHGKQKRGYLPDFYIPHKNMIFEIKNSWLFDILKQDITNKLKAANNLGYETYIFIDKKILYKYEDNKYILKNIDMLNYM